MTSHLGWSTSGVPGLSTLIVTGVQPETIVPP
jgi:hypothetical protein